MKKDKAFVFSHPFLEIKKQNPNMQKEQIRADNKTKHKERDNLRQKLGETVKCSLNPQTNVGKSDPVGVSGQRTKLERRFREHLLRFHGRERVLLRRFDEERSKRRDLCVFYSLTHSLWEYTPQRRSREKRVPVRF